MLVFFFFFQAEDGIRDLYVTGVQTCALPISPSSTAASAAIMIGAEQIATSAVTAMPACVTAVKYVAWKAAMHAPSARQRHASRGPGHSPPVTPARFRRHAPAAGSKSTAATSMRAAPTTSGVASARATSSVVTEPVVPQETAASAMRP